MFGFGRTNSRRSEELRKVFLEWANSLDREVVELSSRIESYNLAQLLNSTEQFAGSLGEIKQLNREYVGLGNSNDPNYLRAHNRLLSLLRMIHDERDRRSVYS